MDQGVEPNRNPNPDLRWEKKEEINIGLDFGFLDGRLNGTVDFYRRRTKDMLWDYQCRHLLTSILQSLLTLV